MFRISLYSGGIYRDRNLELSLQEGGSLRGKTGPFSTFAAPVALTGALGKVQIGDKQRPDSKPATGLCTPRGAQALRDLRSKQPLEKVPSPPGPLASFSAPKGVGPAVPPSARLPPSPLAGLSGCSLCIAAPRRRPGATAPAHVVAAAMLRTLPRALRPLTPGWTLARGWASGDAAQSAEIQVRALRGDRDAGITEILMNRPHTRNALGKVFVSQLSDALDELRLDRSVRVVVFKSCVQGVFCAGADLKEREQMSEPEVAAFVHKLRALMNQIATFPAPTIAALDGFALGGGLELALACDLRVAGIRALMNLCQKRKLRQSAVKSRASSAVMGLIETTRGLLPGAGGTQRLPRCVGVGLAKELIFTGRRISGEEAKAIGLVNHAVPQDQEGTAAYRRSLELAREIVPQAPIAVRMGKVAIDRGMEVDISSGMAIEGMCYAQNIPTRDRLEGMAAFREKRPPRFVGE
uniref:Enoyl-CoA hydratase domain containing 2 n=1 Tax=Monodelphis domestica TaxID=13616 RepID=F6XMQ1_MONDO